MRLVREQLRAFRAEMERDGAAQRAQARRLVAGAAQRAVRLVDSTLTVRPRAPPRCHPLHPRHSVLHKHLLEA